MPIVICQVPFNLHEDFLSNHVIQGNRQIVTTIVAYTIHQKHMFSLFVQRYLTHRGVAFPLLHLNESFEKDCRLRGISSLVGIEQTLQQTYFPKEVQVAFKVLMTHWILQFA